MIQNIIGPDRFQLFKLDGTVTYLTFNENNEYELDMFISDIESRIYAKSKLIEKQNLELSIWSRDYLLEVKCKN